MIEAPSPALFKAQDQNSTQEMYFETSQDAYEWMLSHQGWVLKKRETVNWTYPLEQIISQDCWVKIGRE